VLQRSIQFFNSAFYFPGLSWGLIAAAAALALLFGAIWLAPHRPPVFRKAWPWGIAAVSAVLTWSAIAFVQVPLQGWTGEVLLRFWDVQTLTRWLLVAGIPQILLSGLVQEAAKITPVVFYRRRDPAGFSPAAGIAAGAVAGAGFGVFEAVWVHNMIFASGWTWATVGANGLMALLGFWERFFAVGFHIAASALAGYGLGKHKGWRFYFAASLLHGVTNYSVLLLQSRRLTAFQLELLVAALALIATFGVFLLRRREVRARVVPPPDNPPAAVEGA
jgi:RsiW-degrading membrane proteinase PrsW (M82 family)